MQMFRVQIPAPLLYGAVVYEKRLESKGQKWLGSTPSGSTIYSKRGSVMLFDTNKNKGRAGMSLGIAYFGANGYTVNIPLNDTQWYDFVVEKDGKFYTVQCKATGSKSNYVILKSSGGTNGGVYGTVIDHPLDYLFCIDQNQNMYLLPISELKKYGNHNSLALRTELSKHSRKDRIDISKYRVNI